MRWFITGFLLILLCPSSRMKQKSQMCLSFLEHLEKCSLEAYSLLLLPTSLALILLQIQLAYILYHQIQNLCQRFSCTAFFQPPLLIFLQIRFFSRLFEYNCDTLRLGFRICASAFRLGAFFLHLWPYIHRYELFPYWNMSVAHFCFPLWKRCHPLSSLSFFSEVERRLPWFSLIATLCTASQHILFN